METGVFRAFLVFMCGDCVTGGWNPEWDTPKKMYFLRPFKGHIRDRNRAERASKITKAMEQMPAKIQKYRKVLLLQ